MEVTETSIRGFCMLASLKAWWLPWNKRPETRLPWWLSGKESACNAEDTRDTCLIPGSGRSPGCGHGNVLPVSLLVKSHRWRSLVGHGWMGLQRVRYDWRDWAQKLGENLNKCEISAQEFPMEYSCKSSAWCPLLCAYEFCSSLSVMCPPVRLSSCSR